jgi:hypothetical protein
MNFLHKITPLSKTTLSNKKQTWSNACTVFGGKNQVLSKRMRKQVPDMQRIVKSAPDRTLES